MNLLSLIIHFKVINVYSKVFVECINSFDDLKESSSF